MSAREYWNKRYEDEGKVWGDSPSRTAEYALELFRRHGRRTLLVPGAGYGRNTRLFSSNGFAVTGVEVSDIACRLADEHDPSTVFFEACGLDMTFLKGGFDAVYCFNVLHLFRENERMLFVRQCMEKLNPNGLMFFTVFSEQEPSFGKGVQTEPNTFESRPGRPVHYFTDADLRAHFPEFEILESGLLDDPENHDEGSHTHVVRYVLARKSV